MEHRIQNILVVGGGTSGWITAARLAKKFSADKNSQVSISLIESPEVSGIGVGEGTFPTMRDTLQFLGIPEAEFIKFCNATFKQGIKFVNWENSPQVASNNSYYHLFNTPHSTKEVELVDYWLQGLGNRTIPFSHNLSEQAFICDAGLAPKKITTPEYRCIANYAYHLDAKKFVEFLRDWSTQKLGVNHLIGHIEKVNLDDQGFIDSVTTKEQNSISADLFVDCTGFSCLLLGQALEVPFVDKSDVLFVDHAIAMQVPYVNEQQPIECCTISTAHEAGWTWDIGLQTRRGVGYVYSSAHTSHDRAEQILRQYVGAQSENLSANKIPMKTGYREKFWHKNCVAVGFSAGFLEPLESTALVLVEAAATLISEQFPHTKDYLPIIEKKFNQSFTYRFERIIEFVKLHYCISKREDNAFWIDNREQSSIPERLLDNLEFWKYKAPSAFDFPSIFEIFTLDSYQWILYGMNYHTDLSLSQTQYNDSKQANKEFNKVKGLSTALVNQLPPHRELINKILEFGLAKV